MLSMLLEGRVPNAVTWLGTIFGLIGLAFTYAQARAARNSSDVATRAVERLSEGVALSRVGIATSQLETLRSVIGAGHHTVAASLVSPLRRSIMQIASVTHPNVTNDAILKTPLRNLRTIDVQMALAISGASTFKGSIVLKALAGLDEHLSDAEIALIRTVKGQNDAGA